ncbi:TetR/AcrR family transcriptional regulator [Sneathiella chinensis]|uniref:HTH tetR-type domain-containing protein n=1 Tax=Sneathiella chinensis TaxID=349750 RepID=A0ABQ5U827_9PROT|nr:TetR/AcrR family transcriptional regulator [Sneathiella chinensis]GLQ07345.1 hypothetical protein GCM10007924_25660 [Sneathiella chinensis]
MTRSDARQNRELIMTAFREATRIKASPLPTMSEIVKLSGLGRGTVYRHFPDIGALAFSFIASGYETLFTLSREELRSAADPAAARQALQSHLHRYRAFSKENLALLMRPECLTSEGYGLAYTDHRKCVRRALRTMAGIGVATPPLLETLVDMVARISEPEHLSAQSLTYETPDSAAGPAIDLALSLADTSLASLG